MVTFGAVTPDRQTIFESRQASEPSTRESQHIHSQVIYNALLAKHSHRIPGKVA